MNFIGKVTLWIYLFLFAVSAVLLVVLIFRRQKIKKLEDFEKRDN